MHLNATRRSQTTLHKRYNNFSIDIPHLPSRDIMFACKNMWWKWGHSRKHAEDVIPGKSCLLILMKKRYADEIKCCCAVPRMCSYVKRFVTSSCGSCCIYNCNGAGEGVMYSLGSVLRTMDPCTDGKSFHFHYLLGFGEGHVWIKSSTYGRLHSSSLIWALTPYFKTSVQCSFGILCL